MWHTWVKASCLCIRGILTTVFTQTGETLIVHDSIRKPSFLNSVILALTRVLDANDAVPILNVSRKVIQPI